MIPTLHIRLLGDFYLAYNGTPVTTVNTLRLQSLLAYLVVHHHAPQSRHHLAFLLWPDTTESQAHTNLRNLLHRLRRALPDAGRFLQIDSHTIQWQPDGPFTLDVADFERAAAQASSAAVLAEAVTLYHGDLLPGCYDEWLLAKREQLRQTFTETLERLVLALEAQRDYQTAIHYAQRLLQHDLVHEATYRRLMRIYALNGDRAAALRTYHTCATLLQQELAVEPGPATREVYERLLKQEAPAVRAAPPPAPLAARSPLVGRDQEWERLRGIWRTTVQGQAHFVLISGEAGIGKTRLAEELGEWAKRQGIATASARCYAAQRGLAYAPVVAWLQSGLLHSALSSLADVWLIEIARLLPELLVERPDLPQPGPLTESWQRRRLFEALARATLVCTGNSQPLLLQVDDLQWADPETLDWLHYLLRFDPQAPLLVVGTVRPEEVAAGHPVETLLSSLRPDRQLTEIELGPLDAVQTVALAASVARRELNPILGAQLYQETEGNPLFVVETVRLGILKQQNDALSSHLTALSPTVRAVITARLSQLSASARQLAALAATMGRAFTFEVLAQASFDNEDTLIQGLDELWQRRIVREQGKHAYDFSHDKIREVAYAELSAARRRLLHRCVAQALESCYASDLTSVNNQVAIHYERADLPQQAIPYYQQAAIAARQIYAHDEAIHYYRQALALLSGVDAQNEWLKKMALQLYEGLGDVLTLTGQHDQARGAYQDALRWGTVPNEVERSRLYRKIGNSWRSQHHYEGALQAYSRGENEGQPPSLSTGEQPQEWLQIQLERMWVFYWLNQWSEFEDLAEKTEALIKQHGTPSQQISFFISLGTINLRRNRYLVPEETLSFGRTAKAIAQESGTPGELAWAQFVLGFSLLWYGHLDKAEREMQAALQVAEKTGDVVHQSRCLTYLTIVYRKHGLIKTARDYALRSLATAQTVQMQEYVGTAKANLAWTAWAEGDFVEARANGQAALRSWRQLPAGYASCCFQWTALWPLMAVSTAQNHLAETVDYARLLLAPPQQRLPDQLAAVVSEAIQSWESGQPGRTEFHLNRAIEIAQEMKYL